jgi:hypothetical protein
MKKTALILALVFGISLITFSYKAFAAEPWPYDSPGKGATVCANYSPSTWNTVEAGWLIGQTVYSPAGGDLGQISDLMVDRSDGHIALVILSDVPGFGSWFAAAPFSALERISENTLTLNFGGRDIPLAPTYLTDPYAYELTSHRDTVGLRAIPSAIDPLWAERVYRVYGQTAYWAGGENRNQQIALYRTARPSTAESLFGKTSPVALMAATVQLEGGNMGARIDDVIIDSAGSRAVLLVLDKVPGRGDGQTAVPFGEVSMSGNVLVLNTTEDRVAAAPGFNEDADLHNSQWAENVYKFFGLQPCWDERGTQ